MVYAMVNERFYWAVPGHDSDVTTVHLEAEDTVTGTSMSSSGFCRKCICIW